VIFNQLVALVSTILFVIYLIKGGKYDDDDEDCSALVDQLDTMSIKSFQDYSRKFQEGEQLPKPKVFRIVKKSRVPSFGIGLEYNEERKGVIVQSIEPDSNAEYAGLTTNARIIEINGLVAQGSTIEEVKFKIDAALTEIKILVVEVKADAIYRECKVAVNLRNVEGVTGDENDYKPRLVKLERSDLNEGYGFNLLYLDDRKGEYIEEVQPRGLADRAGLKVGDRIIEVNAMNIETFKSREVVTRIRMAEFSVTMLLVDPKTDGYFRKKAVTITSSLAEEFFDERVGKVRKGKAKKDKVFLHEKTRSNFFPGAYQTSLLPIGQSA
jgi:C-terminal processing protease CtpA/Prc